MSAPGIPVPDHLLDPVAVWESLAPELREQIGIAAVIFAAAEIGDVACQGDEPEMNGWEAAQFESLNRIENLLADQFPEPMKRPHLACIEVRACEECGCTDAMGCPDGCSWVAERLCSRCAPL